MTMDLDVIYKSFKKQFFFQSFGIFLEWCQVMICSNTTLKMISGMLDEFQAEGKQMDNSQWVSHTCDFPHVPTFKKVGSSWSSFRSSKFDTNRK